MRTLIFIVCLSIAQAVAPPASGQTATNPCEGYRPADLKSPLPFLRLAQCRAKCMPSGRPTPSDADLEACVTGGTKTPDLPTGSIATTTAPPARSSFVTSRGAQAIARIVISDEANSSGRVSMIEKPSLNRMAPKIFVVVQVTDATRGTAVSVWVTYLRNNSSLGPLSSKITADGGVMKAFSFSNTAKTWPVGSFRVTVKLSDGTERTKDFTIR